MSDILHIKYRPRHFAEVVGQAVVVKSLAKLIERGGAQAFLLSGPSGTGKTTLARIAARAAGCSDQTLLEIDAATHTGVDAMRDIQMTLQYLPFGKTKARAVIIDEAHALSRQSWQSLLKIVEEPPPQVYWFFCTTEGGKVPPTIKTRCASFTLKLVADGDLLALVNRIAAKEKINISDSICNVIVKEALGSPRQALVNLALCRDVKDYKEAADILRSAMQSDPVLELCRFLIKGGSWTRAVGLVEKLSDEAPESVRIVVCNYVASVLRNAKSDREAVHGLHILDAFSPP